jgi:cold shock CspA family protein
MSSSEQGKIVFWNEDGGYGFIKPDRANERDAFFHISALSEEVRIGDRVSFEAGTDKLHRPCAKNVRIVNGDGQEDVQEEVQEEREQAAADYEREENPLAQALRRAHHE